jgi:hypothetical protein
MIAWDIEKLAEDLYSSFWNNIFRDFGIKYYSSYGDVLKFGVYTRNKTKT